LLLRIKTLRKLLMRRKKKSERPWRRARWAKRLKSKTDWTP